MNNDNDIFDMLLPLDFDLGLSINPDLRNVPDIIYPCILLDSISYIDSLKVLKKVPKSVTREFKAWIFVDGQFVDIGILPLTFDTLYVLRYLKIIITIYFSESSIETLDLQNSEILTKFI